jgi:hypothetical protein
MKSLIFQHRKKYGLQAIGFRWMWVPHFKNTRTLANLPNVATTVTVRLVSVHLVVVVLGIDRSIKNK